MQCSRNQESPAFRHGECQAMKIEEIKEDSQAMKIEEVKELRIKPMLGGGKTEV